MYMAGVAFQYPVNLSGHGALCRKLNVLAGVSDTKKKRMTHSRLFTEIST